MSNPNDRHKNILGETKMSEDMTNQMLAGQFTLADVKKVELFLTYKREGRVDVCLRDSESKTNICSIESPYLRPGDTLTLANIHKMFKIKISV